jgi:putative ATP-binding cassette transporter
MAARSTFLRETWRLIKPYWTSEERKSAWILLVAVVALTLAMVYMNVQFNYWNNDFYNALQEKDKAAFWRLMGRFTILATIYISLAVYAFYLNQLLQIRWRRWMTDVYLRDWLKERNYYRMQLSGAPTDNPDQRISEDMKYFVDETLSLSLGFLRSIVTLGSFVGILWGLSGPLAIPFGGSEISIPGYMVWAAVLYAIAGTWLTNRIGRSLIGMNFQQQRFEADFRFSLIRFRENAESIALLKGESNERARFTDRFAKVVQNWWQITKRQKILNSFTIGYGQAAIIFPFLVAGNRYFSGAIQLGGLMQISNAFGQVQGSLSWFVDAYSGNGPNTGFVGWKATADRLIGFRHSIDDAHAHVQSGVERLDDARRDLSLDDVAVTLPNGTALLTAPYLVLNAGESWLIRGPSGSGKSTLFRAIAGIWPFGSGRVHLPEGQSILFLPQKPYLPIGNLREVISYPARDGGFGDDAIRDALGAVGLPHLATRLDEPHNWSMQLSPGEQQRIAFARALLQRPAWLFLDEATSSLDEAAEKSMYALLKERLPETTLVSIGHRATLQAMHSRTLELKDNGSGTRSLAPA